MDKPLLEGSGSGHRNREAIPVNDLKSLFIIQENILVILKETNGIELESLAEKLGLKLSDLQRKIATLRHMEKLKAAMAGDKKVFRLWQ